MMADLKDEMLDAFMAIAPKRGKSRKFTLMPCGEAALARRSQADVARSVAFQREINGATGIPETPAEKRPKPTEELRPDPLLTDAEYFHQRRVKPGKDVGKAPVLVNKLELIGGLARLGGVKEWQEAAAAKYRLLHERSQIGGAKAIDYAAVKVDTSGPSEDAVFIVGANARADPLGPLPQDAWRREMSETDHVAAHGRCGICFFADLEHAGTVECRRFPPAPYFEPTGRVTNIRPRVGAYYWCGEFKPLPPPPGDSP
jgi:hypothetical protein